MVDKKPELNVRSFYGIPNSKITLMPRWNLKYCKNYDTLSFHCTFQFETSVSKSVDSKETFKKRLFLSCHHNTNNCKCVCVCVCLSVCVWEREFEQQFGRMTLHFYSWATLCKFFGKGWDYQGMLSSARFDLNTKSRHTVCFIDLA